MTAAVQQETWGNTLQGLRSAYRHASPQGKMIINHLRHHGGLSHYEAFTLYRIAALPRRISDLEANGVRIIRQRKTDPTGRAYVRYFLAPITA